LMWLKVCLYRTRPRPRLGGVGLNKTKKSRVPRSLSCSG